MLLAAALGWPGCAPEVERTDVELRPCSVLVVAVDGLDWKVIAPLVAEDRLPVMASLMQSGTFGYLESMEPTRSPVIWTSMATGKLPDKHGIHGFTYQVPEDGSEEPRYFTSGHRRTKAFWNILSDYGDTVHLFGWWITYPAEPIRGVLVSQTNTTGAVDDRDNAIMKGALLQGVEGQVHPPERHDRVMATLTEVDRSMDQIAEAVLGVPPYPPSPFAELMWNQSLWAVRADTTYLRAAGDVLGSGEPFGLLGIYFGGPDVVGHRFWRYANPDEFRHPPSSRQIENFGNVIDDYYAWIDRAVGELLELAPSDVGVLIVSDHGMEAINTERRFRVDDRPLERNSAGHPGAPPGVVIASGGCFARPSAEAADVRDMDPSALRTLGTVLDITPTLLAVKGLPVGEDMDGRPLAGLMREAGAGLRIRTHDTRDWLEARRDRMREAVDQAERLEQLRSLGYIP